MPDRRRLSSPTDEDVFSESSGPMSIDCPSEDGWKTLELPNAFYVPQSSETCLSVSMLLEQHANSRLEFTPEGCSVELNLGKGQVIRLQAESKGCFNFTLEKFSGFLSGMSTPSESRNLSPWTSPPRSLPSSTESSTRSSSIWDTPRSPMPPVSRRKQRPSYLDEDEEDDSNDDSDDDEDKDHGGDDDERSTDTPHPHSPVKGSMPRSYPRGYIHSYK
ncbi:hypothetical protein N7540_007343 [Penicillium herquei]|nr:hypothetical protein N7540_007343 [Penicillium herquei]